MTTSLDTTPIIFGLTRDELRPVVARVAGQAAASFEIRADEHAWPHYGVRGDKRILTVRYVTVVGGRGRARVFVKRQCDPVRVGGRPVEPRPVEAHHYEHLAALGAPIPRLYTPMTVNDPQPREILFLEHLPGVVCEGEPWAAFQNDGERFGRYLSAVAQFNAIAPSGAYAARLPRPHHHLRRQMADWEPKLDELWRDAREGRLGDALRTACTGDGRKRLWRLARRVREAIDGMESGLSAGDHEPFQSGWRETGDAVLFDLEHVGLAPRFYDVAVTLGAPVDYCPRCRPGRELARHYLAEHVGAGGRRVSVEQFLLETRLLWLAWTIGWIGCWRRAARDGRPEARELLSRKLRFLLCEAS